MKAAVCKAPEYRMFLKSKFKFYWYYKISKYSMQLLRALHLHHQNQAEYVEFHFNLFLYSSGLLIAKQRSVEMLIMRKASKFIRMFFNGFHTYGKSMMKNWFSKSKSNRFVSIMMTPMKMMSTMASVIRVWWKLDFISGLLMVILIVDDKDFEVISDQFYKNAANKNRASKHSETEKQNSQMKNYWGPLSSTFHMEQPETLIECKFKSITYGHTDMCRC